MQIRKSNSLSQSSTREEEDHLVTETAVTGRKLNSRKLCLRRSHVGDVVDGVVKNVTDFGAFIDLGGADGLLHISEMSWGRVENPKKIFKVGETD